MNSNGEGGGEGADSVILPTQPIPYKALVHAKDFLLRFVIVLQNSTSTYTDTSKRLSQRLKLT